MNMLASTALNFVLKSHLLFSQTRPWAIVDLNQLILNLRQLAFQFLIYIQKGITEFCHLDIFYINDVLKNLCLLLIGISAYFLYLNIF